jgi:membrane fusion protein (multidrug efflux system)
MKLGPIIGGAAILLALLGVGGGLGYWKYSSIQKAMAAPPPPEPAEAIEITTVTSRPWIQTARLVGAVFATQSVVLSNEIAGVIKEITFESGSIVEQGQVLISLDSSTEEADLSAALASEQVSRANITFAEAEVRSARAAVNFSESDVRRLSQAVESKAAAETTLDRARADLEQSQAKVAQMTSGVARAKSELEQAQAKVQQLRVAIEKKTLRAPFRARVGIRTVHRGQYLAENSKLVNLEGVADTAYLDFAVPQDEAWRVKPGQIVPATSKALGEGIVPLTVQAIDASVDPGTRNVRIRSIFANPGEKLRPGTFVDVEVPMAAPVERVIIPATAVRRSSYGDHVFVLTPGEKGEGLRAHQRFVKLGLTVGQEIIVEEGLKVGEQIASAGAFKLRENVLVMPAPAAGAAASGAGGKPAGGSAGGTGGGSGGGDEKKSNH